MVKFHYISLKSLSSKPFLSNIKDHTLGNEYGSFMYIKAAAPTKPASVARFISPISKKSGPQCLSFYYYMLESNSIISILINCFNYFFICEIDSKNDFNVYVNVSTVSTKVWSKSSNQGSRVWLNFNFNFNFLLFFL